MTFVNRLAQFLRAADGFLNRKLAERVCRHNRSSNSLYNTAFSFASLLSRYLLFVA
jgi:hypothetical protein